MSMQNQSKWVNFLYFRFVFFASVIILCFSVQTVRTVAVEYLSPDSMVLAPDGRILYIAERTAGQIAVFDVETGKVQDTIPVPAEPTGLAISHGGETLYVTCGAPLNGLCAIDINDNKIAYKIRTGPGACSPTVSADGSRVYVCNRLKNNVTVIDSNVRKKIRNIPVGREPSSAALTPDGSLLLVANQLPQGRADANAVASTVHIIHTRGLQIVAQIELPNGSTALKGICVSPDGCYAFVSHVLARFQMPTTQLERGWMNTNALTVIDIKALKRLNTVLLDNIDHGAANPWGVACSPDGKYVCVTHAGTHELSLIDLPALIEKLNAVPEFPTSGYSNYGYSQTMTSSAEVPNDLTFLNNVRRRIELNGNGPRNVIIAGNKAYISHYFSDNLNGLGLAMEGRIRIEDYPLGNNRVITMERQGEKLFHDATLCFQGWQSCSSCHPDARVDGLNWDLLNDGIGNPKNTKSLLYSHATPPAMSTGVRGDAETAVRSGFKHILFAVRPDEESQAIDEYLKNLKPLPSPLLIRGELNEKAKRGRELFFDPKTGCASCHAGKFHTDLRSYNVDTRSSLDRQDDFDNPTLIELWRSGPYLHDGRAATLRDVLTIWNPTDRHGATSHLSETEIADLEAFLLSL